jgi:hypothetical protein
MKCVDEERTGEGMAAKLHPRKGAGQKKKGCVK